MMPPPLASTDRARQCFRLRFSGPPGVAFGIYWSSGLLLLSGTTYLFRNDFSAHFLGVFSLLLACAIAPTFTAYRWAPMYLLRIALLGTPCLLANVILLIKPGVFVAYHGQRFQTAEITAALTLLTTLGLAASGITWGIGSSGQTRISPPRPCENFSIRYFIYAAIAVFAGAANAQSLGPLLWKASYASQTAESFLSLGVYPTIAMFGLIGMRVVILYARQATRFHTVLFWCISAYVLLFCMWFRGMRLEVCASLVVLYLLHVDAKAARIKVVRMGLLAAGLFLLAQVWGAYRAIADAGGSLIAATRVVMSSLGQNIAEVGTAIYHYGTASDVAAVLFNTYGLIQEKSMSLMLGQTYLEWLPRTLPQFIYPDRPVSIAWIFPKFGETSGGGIFELAEAYANFGAVGVILVPGIITFLLCRIYRASLTRRTTVTLFAYAAAVSMLPRGIWYQNFALYKSALIWLILEAAILTLTAVHRTWIVPMLRSLKQGRLEPSSQSE
ncbi:MAG: hypothetical protein ACE5FN_00320 [Leptospirillia bacterium]